MKDQYDVVKTYLLPIICFYHLCAFGEAAAASLNWTGLLVNSPTAPTPIQFNAGERYDCEAWHTALVLRRECRVRDSFVEVVNQEGKLAEFDSVVIVERSYRGRYLKEYRYYGMMNNAPLRQNATLSFWVYHGETDLEGRFSVGESEERWLLYGELNDAG